MKNSHFFKIVHGAVTAAIGIMSAAAVMMTGLFQLADAATSVSQFGITWTFSADKTVGQYANGDWWVVGPVTITSISPASTTDGTGWTRNGTMVNPVAATVNPGQGYDSSVHLGSWWDGSLNLAPGFTGRALTVSVNSSVISTISQNTPDANVYDSNPQIAAGSVLTVVASAPAAGSFRPPMVGNDKTHWWNKASLNYGILQNLAPVASTAALDTVKSYFEKPWFFQFEGSSVQAMSPASNMPAYSREQANTLSQGLLSLHLNYPDAQKEVLYIRLVQVGIDVYGATKAGTVWKGEGGQNAGRKAPMLLAGLALNDANILGWADASKHLIFQEDQQTWFVTQYDVGRVMTTADGRPRNTYTQSMVGLPEWGEQHIIYPANDASNWSSAYYRWIGGAFLGNILAIKLIPGGQKAWNWPAVFAYADRYWGIESVSPSWSPPNAIIPFVADMWRAYHNTSGTIQPPPVVTLAIGDRIKTLNITNVRASGALTATLLGTQAQGSFGTIIAGPVPMDNFTWWQVNFDSGADGWCGEDNFAKQTAPSTPQGFKAGP